MNIKHEFSDDNLCFNYNSWRSYISRLISGYDKSLEVIIPFGFELTGNASYLNKTLKRFYVYVGYKNEINGIAIKRDISALLINDLRSKYPIFFSIIYEVDIQERKIKLNGQNLKIIIYERKINQPLLIDWASYILSTPINIYENRLPDILQFDGNIISRSYIFQLSIMYHYIFDFAQLDNESFEKVHYLSTPYRIHEKKSCNNLEYCVDVLNSCVRPQIFKIISTINNTGYSTDVTTIDVMDYHSVVFLNASLKTDVYNYYLEMIVSAYSKYGT